MDLDRFPGATLSLLNDTLEEEIKQGSGFRSGECSVGPLACGTSQEHSSCLGVAAGCAVSVLILDA